MVERGSRAVAGSLRRAWRQLSRPGILGVACCLAASAAPAQEKVNASSTANRSYVLLRHSNPVHLPNVADITVSPPGCCTLGTPDQEPAQVSIQNMDGKSSSPPNDVITVTAP